MSFQTTFKLETFIKSCNALRLSVCSDGEATLDKWVALAEKHAVNGEITFTKQIVRNLNRYADAIADTGVSYVYGEDDEFSTELQLCLWALSPRYRVGSVLQIGEDVETLRWVAEHYAERFDAELEDAIKGIPYRRRLKYQAAFPTSPMTLKYVRTLDQVLANYNFDASTMDCIEKLYGEIDYYGHIRADNKVITLIYQQLDTLLDNKISLTTLINSDNGRRALVEIFKSPKAFAQYWERLAAYGFKTEVRGGVKTVVDYNNWFIDMSIDVRGLLNVLNDMWDIYLPTKSVGTRIMSKHYEIVGELPLEDKVYFTELPLSAIQSLYPDFKVMSFQDFINGKSVNEPIVITYPERRTMAHVILKGRHDKVETPTRANHPVIYVGWPVVFTRKHLNIVEYDGMIEVVDRVPEHTHRFASLYPIKPEVNLGDLYLNSGDKPYTLDHIAKEELGFDKVKFEGNPSFSRNDATIGDSGSNMTGMMGRGLTRSQFFSDYNLTDLHHAAMMRQSGKSGMVSDFFKRWVDNIETTPSDFDGDELSFTINKESFPFEHEIGQTPAPVRYPIVHSNPMRRMKDTERFNFRMGRHYIESIDESSPHDFGDRLHIPLITPPLMVDIQSASRMMADQMNKLLTHRDDAYSEPTVVSNTNELLGDTHKLSPFNQHGTPSRLQMAVGVIDIAEAYPNAHIGVDLGKDTDKE